MLQTDGNQLQICIRDLTVATSTFDSDCMVILDWQTSKVRIAPAVLTFSHYKCDRREPAAPFQPCHASTFFFSGLDKVAIIIWNVQLFINIRGSFYATGDDHLCDHGGPRRSGRGAKRPVWGCACALRWGGRLFLLLMRWAPFLLQIRWALFLLLMGWAPVFLLPPKLQRRGLVF